MTFVSKSVNIAQIGLSGRFGEIACARRSHILSTVGPGRTKPGASENAAGPAPARRTLGLPNQPGLDLRATGRNTTIGKCLRCEPRKLIT